MEDEGSLELSLGLFCGPSSSNKSKVNSSDPKIVNRVSKELMVGSLNVVESSLGPLYPSNVDSNGLGGQQRHVNFWKSPGQPNIGAMEDEPRCRQMWGLDEKVITVEDKLGQNKRKMPFEDINIAKKIEMGKKEDEAQQNNLTDCGMKSHISVNSEDGSSADNEAVAESENEASNSWYISHHKVAANDSLMHNLSDNRVYRNSDPLPYDRGSSGISIREQKMVHGNFQHGVLPSPQPGAGTVVPVKSLSVVNASTMEGSHLSVSMQHTPVSDATEHSMSQAMKGHTSHLSSFGYQSTQLPTLETNASWMFGPHPDRKSAADAQLNSSQCGDRTEAFRVGRTIESPKGSGKHTDEVGMSSTPSEEETDGNRAKLSPAQQIEGFPSEGSVIRPGIAPGLKFGGCGSYPDLPWVSVTGTGPNGKMISGVTYKFSKNQIKIVCACHGSHMSPEEFIQHANGNAEPASLRNGNPAASAQS